MVLVGISKTQEKQCSVCKEIKSLDLFYKRKVSKDGRRSQCKVCSEKQTREYITKNTEKRKQTINNWRKNNSERVKEYTINYYKNNADIIRKRSRDYRKNNPWYIIQYKINNRSKILEGTRNYHATHKDQEKIYRQNNKEMLTLYKKKYYELNKISHLQKNKIWKKNHKDLVHLSVLRRRARKTNVKENYTIEDKRFTLNLFSNKCFVCESEYNLNIDHNYPLSRGYALSRKNAVVLCKSCNSFKKEKLPEEFYNKEQLEKLNSLLGIKQ